MTMTQAHGVQTQDQQDQHPLQRTKSFMLLSALAVLAGAVFCVCITALTHQLLLALLLCLIPAGTGAALIQLILRKGQNTQDTLLTSFTTTCLAVLEGNSTARVQLPAGSKEPVTPLFGKTLNRLLDGYTYLQKDTQARQQELARLYDQMEQLVYEMKPVMDGDLRTRSTVAGGTLGNIAAMCNTLVEDTAQLVQWAQYMSDQIIQTSHRLMGLSLEIAQIMETFVKQHETTTRTIEALMAFTLRMESALFSNVEIFQHDWAHLQQHKRAAVSLTRPRESQGDAAHQPVMTELFYDIPRQIKLLENLSQKTHETTTLAEGTIRDLRDVEQRFQHLNGAVVQFASTISSLAALADNWRQAADSYALPPPAEAEELFVEAQQASPPPPEQASYHQRTLREISE